MTARPDTELRRAQPRDWPAVEALLSATKLPIAGAREHLSHYLLVVSQGKVVGCGGLELYGDIALLRSIAVAPSNQGRRIGNRLVQGLLSLSRDLGIRTLFLLTVTAPDYFAKQGFVRRGLDEAPDALKASEELRGACPWGAIMMLISLDQGTK